MLIPGPIARKPEPYKLRFQAASRATGVSLLAALILALCAPLPAADKGQAQHTVSRELVQPLTQARAAVDKGMYAEALAMLKQADANSQKTLWDQHVINELFLYAYAKTGHYAEAAKALEATINDALTDPVEAQERIKELTTIYYRLNDYGNAVRYAQRAIQGAFADATIYAIASDSYYLKGDFQAALHFTNSRIDEELKKGDIPSETQLRIVLNSCIKLEDPACTSQALERMISYYPKPEYWQRLIDTLYQTKQARSDDEVMLDIYRLADEVDAVGRPQDYTNMAKLALERGFPRDAQRVLEKGFTKGLFSDERSRSLNQRLLNKAKAQSAADQGALAKLEHDASKAATGDQEAALGVAYLSYQQYDKAVQALRQGLVKGVKSPAQTQLLFGIAELKSGDRDAAMEAFRHVKDDDKVLERLANLWGLHVKRTIANQRAT